jgi:hypothetical protein
MESAARSGCPTALELSQLQSSVPGQAPEELARHVAACERCQQRVLFGDSARATGKRREPPEWPSPKRALLLLLAVLVAFAMLLYSLQRLRTLFG